MYWIIFHFWYFIFPYFHGNFWNSRAGLEFKEFRLFSKIIFQKDDWNSMFFSKKSSWKSQNPLGCFKNNIEFHFQKIVVEKNRNSLNSKLALEFKEFAEIRKKENKL